MNGNEGKGPGIYGLLGYKIQYSLSPRIHNHIFSIYGIKAIYGLFDLPPKDFLKGISVLIEKAEGFNVTTPYKEETAGILKELSQEAKQIGSVNLVKDGRGYNTDYLALDQLVGRHLSSLQGKECIIFGSGGAARTAAFLFGKKGMYISVINRSHDRARKLESDLTEKGIDAQAVTLNSEISSETMESAVFVNCISYPEFRYPTMRAGLAVDFNYALRSGDYRRRLQGKPPLITGEEILVAQAIHSQRIWNNIEPDFNETMEAIDVKLTG